MWKRVVKGAEERRRVMKMAALKLIPPSQFREKLKSGLLCGVLPKIPKSRPDITMFLMQAKFCVKEKSKVSQIFYCVLFYLIIYLFYG